MCHAMFIQVDDLYHAESAADEIHAASLGAASEAGDDNASDAREAARVVADNQESIAAAA